jgi:hypothetical protein
VISDTQAASVRRVGWVRRIGYAFIGLLAGNAAIVAYFLITNLWGLVRVHSFPSEPPAWHTLVGYAGLILIYGTFSLLGWLVVGLPAVFLLPVRILNRLPWLVILLIAAAIGLAAFFPIYLLLNGGHLTPNSFSFRSEWLYWFLALLASMTGFPTYCWLVRRRTITRNP